jgi:hypothetical protein
LNVSKRHHYIPQFYLRGFTNENESYFVFDKEKEEIRETVPQNSFFQNRRNTSIIGNEKSVLLEDMYSHFDNLTAPELRKIQELTLENFKLEPVTLHRIKMFITQIYWRIPKNDVRLDKLIDKLSFSEIGFGLKDKEGKSVATKELEEELKNEDIFRKMYRFFIPLMSYQEKYKTTDFENWRVYFRGNNYQLTGDNPLIIENFKDFSSLNKELIFPLSSNKIFLHTKRPKPTNLPSKFMIDMDMMIIQQAKRFVCCSDRVYLNYLIENLYSFSKNHDLENKMKENLFNNFR